MYRPIDSTSTHTHTHTHRSLQNVNASPYLSIIMPNFVHDMMAVRRGAPPCHAGPTEESRRNGHRRPTSTQKTRRTELPRDPGCGRSPRAMYDGAAQPDLLHGEAACASVGCGRTLGQGPPHQALTHQRRAVCPTGHRWRERGPRCGPELRCWHQRQQWNPQSSSIPREHPLLECAGRSWPRCHCVIRQHLLSQLCMKRPRMLIALVVGTSCPSTGCGWLCRGTWRRRPSQKRTHYRRSARVATSCLRVILLDSLGAPTGELTPELPLFRGICRTAALGSAIRRASKYPCKPSSRMMMVLLV
jgi:hypothetical protein